MVWVVGAKGMLGREVVSLLNKSGTEHVDSDLDCDITDLTAVRAFARGKKIAWIVNCSAYTAVDRAESEEDKAYRVNALEVDNLATIATGTDAKIVRISTDYVVRGDARSPYTEETPTDPIGAYGRTKIAGEKALQEKTPRHFIIRTAWLYGPAGKNWSTPCCGS